LQFRHEFVLAGTPGRIISRSSFAAGAGPRFPLSGLSSVRECRDVVTDFLCAVPDVQDFDGLFPDTVNREIGQRRKDQLCG
jgi:hypothetical protein